MICTNHNPECSNANHKNACSHWWNAGNPCYVQPQQSDDDGDDDVTCPLLPVVDTDKVVGPVYPVLSPLDLYWQDHMSPRTG